MNGMETAELTKEIERLPSQKRTELNNYLDVLLQPVKQLKPKISSKKAIFGSAKGKLWMADDFDELLDNFKDYM
jgi:hypothetical protein